MTSRKTADMRALRSAAGWRSDGASRRAFVRPGNNPDLPVLAGRSLGPTGAYERVSGKGLRRSDPASRPNSNDQGHSPLSRKNTRASSIRNRYRNPATVDRTKSNGCCSPNILQPREQGWHALIKSRHYGEPANYRNQRVTEAGDGFCSSRAIR